MNLKSKLLLIIVTGGSKCANWKCNDVLSLLWNSQTDNYLVMSSTMYSPKLLLGVVKRANGDQLLEYNVGFHFSVMKGYIRNNKNNKRFWRK